MIQPTTHSTIRPRIVLEQSEMSERVTVVDPEEVRRPRENECRRSTHTQTALKHQHARPWHVFDRIDLPHRDHTFCFCIAKCN